MDNILYSGEIEGAGPVKWQMSLEATSKSSSPLSALSRSPTPPDYFDSSTSSSALNEAEIEAKSPAAKRWRVSHSITGLRDNQYDFAEPHMNTRLSSRTPAAYSDQRTEFKSTREGLLSWLESDALKIKDPLRKLPRPDYTYIDASGKLKDPHKYDFHAPVRVSPPALKRHEELRMDTQPPRLYYRDIPRDVRLAIAGVARGKRSNEQFRDQVLTLSVNSQEESFHARPSIKLVIPDHLKAILVDDWENVTKNQQLVPLPTPHPVNSILAHYLAAEKPKRQNGSAQADILEEVVAGLKEYFEKCLGRILLYRFERNQYLEMRELWAAGEGEWAGKGAGDTYGAEHMCRLLVSLPELIAQTNMDQQSVNRLREELAKLTNWLGKHATEYFVSEYETPSQSYIEKARGY
ncbi:MAG: Esa1p-associated factor [Claussenomyces sp. TS43310]|nr:MAG: Esa1p-associated factor [Claussenomyces sp. TS43310]